jgi:hypothetical protein
MSKKKNQTNTPAPTPNPMPEESAPAQPQQQRFHIKYETMTAVFADHVVLNGTNGGLLLDFASSIVADPVTGESTIPVHTRVAMTLNGAAQLHRMLSGVFNRPEGQ